MNDPSHRLPIHAALVRARIADPGRRDADYAGRRREGSLRRVRVTDDAPHASA